ncbi:MAG: FAD-dependent oxidoreductase, partial [Clostridia bacterium]|nr:FAD-dependent oxidoreductase [Clostridia bacterium]
MYDIIIIGAGPAGLTAALYARRAGHSVLVLEAGVPGGQAVTTPHVENWPGTVSVSGPDFAMGLYEQAQSLGAEIRFAAAQGLRDLGSHKVVATDSGDVEGKSVILSNGVRRRKLDVPGEDKFGGKGVSYCATCDGNFFKGKDVAVVGGGNTAVEDAIYLASICPTVWLIHRRSELTAQKYLVDNLKEKANVKYLMDHKLLEVQGDAQVNALRLMGPENQRILHVSGVFAAVRNAARRRVHFDQRGDGGADLDAFAVVFGRERAGIGFAVGRELAGLVLVAVEAVDLDAVEDFEISLPHAGEGEPVEPGVVGDEADDALSGRVHLHDAPLGHAEETDVE